MVSFKILYSLIGMTLLSIWTMSLKSTRLQEKMVNFDKEPTLMWEEFSNFIDPT